VNAALQTALPEHLALAASPQLAENSRLGFAPVASTSRWGFSFSISSNTLGLSGSLYDGRVRSRSTGKERDSESGNDYFGARYYSSAMGRFMSPDWSAKVTPVPYANLGDPQSLNLYAYARNNPLIHIDANGHCWSWLQGACNFFQQAYHGIFTDDGFKTNAQVTDQTNKRRDALNQFNVVTPDKKGNTIDWSKATKKQVDGSYNALFSGGQINMNGPNFVSPGEAGSNPNTANATDAAGVAGLASDGKASKALGYVSAGTSLLNDPSPANGAITVLGLIPGPDVPIAIGTAAYDGSQFAAGVITSVVTAPSQANAVDESDPCSYGACQP
jgi:RHS repeat-associated protein